MDSNGYLYAPNSAAHYNETSHTPTADLGLMSSGGTVSATCDVCHDLSMRPAHGAANGGFESTNRGTYLTCEECHAYNAQVSAIVDAKWPNKSCADCHNATVLGAAESMHTTASPVAMGSSVAGCGATGPGCHTTYDLHDLHKDKGCTLAGCHDTKNKDMQRVAKACGDTTGCHVSSQYSNTLHNGLDGGASDSVHDASVEATRSLTGFVQNPACTMCHSTKIRPAHATTPEWTDPYCTNCHYAQVPYDAVSVIKSGTWNKECSACHTVRHDSMVSTHDGSTAGFGCAPPSAETTQVRLPYYTQNFDGGTAPGYWPTDWAKSGSPAVVTSATGTSTPNAAYFVSNASATAKQSTFTKTFNLAGKTNPQISFKYKTDFPTTNVTMFETILPQSSATTTGWACIPAGAWATSLDTTDGVTYMQTSAQSLKQNLNMDNYVSGRGTITSVTVSAWMWCDAGNARLSMDTGGTAVNGTNFTVSSLDWTKYNFTRTTNPANGAWTWANVNALRVGVGTRTATQLNVKADKVQALVQSNVSMAGSYLKAEYSVNDGASWTSVVPTVTATTAWTSTSAIALPQQDNVQVRFTMYSTHTNQALQVDDIAVTTLETVDVTNSMHSESFDSVTAPNWPATWTKGGTDAAQLVTTSSQKRSGTNSAVFSSSAAAAQSAYFDRTFNLFNVRDPRLKFWYATSTDGNGDSLKAEYSTNGGSTWFDIMPETTANTAGQWTQFISQKLPRVNNVLVRFTTASNRTTDYVYVDDIDLYYLPGDACHDVTDVMELHDTDTGPGCASCHISADTLPLPIQPGCGANGVSSCHTGAAHASAHNVTAASDYAESAESVSSESGCTNSGAGCHGSQAMPADGATTFHPTSGCLGGACHTSPSMTQSFKDSGAGTECARCHNGTFSGAADTTGLAQATPAGHFGDTTHTVSAGLGTMTAGGSASAGCSACHSTTLRNAHGASGGGFASTTKGAYVTCAECHNYNASVTALVTDTTRTDDCAACHTASVMPTSAMHNAATAPTALSTSAACGNSGSGCHTSLDLHGLHKNAAAGCVLSGCHAANKDMAGASKTCGSGQGCHTTYTATTGHRANTISGDDSTHTATAMTTKLDSATYSYGNACSDCHSAGLKSAHTTVTATLDSGHTAWTTPFCTDCHNSTYAEANSVTTIKTDSWSAQTCDQCHVTNGNGKHTTYTLAAHTATRRAVRSSGSCARLPGTTPLTSARCTTRSTAGCTATGSDSKGWSGGCHAPNKSMTGTAR